MFYRKIQNSNSIQSQLLRDKGFKWLFQFQFPQTDFDSHFP